MALPPSYTLDIVCGQPLQVVLPVLTAAGAPVDPALITSARAQVRATWNDNQVLYEWATTSGNASVGAGGVTLTATAVETVDWQFQWPSSPVWDLRVVDGTGVVHRLTDAGSIRLYPAITR